MSATSCTTVYSLISSPESIARCLLFLSLHWSLCRICFPERSEPSTTETAARTHDLYSSSAGHFGVLVRQDTISGHLHARRSRHEDQSARVSGSGQSHAFCSVAFSLTRLWIRCGSRTVVPNAVSSNSSSRTAARMGRRSGRKSRRVLQPLVRQAVSPRHPLAGTRRISHHHYQRQPVPRPQSLDPPFLPPPTTRMSCCVSSRPSHPPPTSQVKPLLQLDLEPSSDRSRVRGPDEQQQLHAARGLSPPNDRICGTGR